MSYETVQIEKSDSVALVKLNRPDKKNAMSPQLHEDMTNALEELRYDNDARVLVITGAGNAFCAGMDLKEVFHALKDQPARYDRVIRLATEWRGRTLRYFPKPTIAMVNGYCFGGAFSIVEGCDLAIAARIGFVNFAVPLAQLESETMAVAREIARKDPAALKATKDGYRFSLEMTWEASMNYTSAKEEELAARQRIGWKDEGVGDFVKGKFKPGLESHESIKS
jgi:trans-feruloyl-CoA hydratase/vanillin synthase